MYFEDLTGDEKLWAVRFEEYTENELNRFFFQLDDVEWLRDFFNKNFNDLSYFQVNDVDQAITDTLNDAVRFENFLFNFSSYEELDKLFRPLNDNRHVADTLEKEKAKLGYTSKHDSWLRVYAIKLADGNFIITGGTIKLVKNMKERPNTELELKKLERVRQFLLENGIIDDLGFIDYIAEL